MHIRWEAWKKGFKDGDLTSIKLNFNKRSRKKENIVSTVLQSFRFCWNKLGNVEKCGIIVQFGFQVSYISILPLCLVAMYRFLHSLRHWVGFKKFIIQRTNMISYPLSILRTSFSWLHEVVYSKLIKILFYFLCITYSLIKTNWTFFCSGTNLLLRVS